MEKDDKLKDIAIDRIIDSLFEAGLTENEKDFILYYLDSHNIYQSYLKAFHPKSKSYARVSGSLLFNKPHIQAALKRAKKILAVTYDIDPSRYVETLLKASFADIGDYITFKEEDVPIYDKNEGIPIINPDTGEPVTRKVSQLHFKDSAEVDTSVIAEVRQGKEGITIKMMDKLKALDKLKEFFDWGNTNNENQESRNSLLEALNSQAVNVWGQEEIDKDLEKMENQHG